MGFNTVLMVLNDTVHVGAEDHDIGQRILNAVRYWSIRDREPSACDIFARSARGSASYGRVISQAHADYSQVVVVGQNSGRPLSECKELDFWTIDQLKAALERSGYRVIKRRKLKEAAA